MTKEQEELLKAVNFPFNYPTTTDCPSEKKAKSSPTKHATTNTQKIVKEKEVGKNANPTTTPSTRSSTMKKDTATTNADLKTIVPKKQVECTHTPSKGWSGLNLKNSITNLQFSMKKRLYPINYQ